MKGNLRIVLMSIWCFGALGCVSNEGISVRLTPDSFGSKELVKYGALPGVPNDEDAEKTVTGLVAIGYTSSYRRISEEDAAQKYSQYTKFYERWGLDRDPALSATNFAKSIGGWTRLKVFGIPLVGATYVMVLVPRMFEDEVTFSSVTGTFMLQTDGDLVSAHTNEDGVFVLSGLLCKENADLSNCEKNYKKGRFDSTTGEQLDGKLRPKKNGVRLDPASLRVVEPGSADQFSES